MWSKFNAYQENMKEKRGGPRLAVREDDKRIIRKLNNPVRVTITLELKHLEWLQSQGTVSEVIRELIELALLDF